MTILHQHGLQIGVEYHVVELHRITNEIYQWCENQFGLPGARWFARSPKLYFTSKSDHMMFLLRWS
jgi:hypothetical protein